MADDDDIFDGGDPDLDWGPLDDAVREDKGGETPPQAQDTSGPFLDINIHNDWLRFAEISRDEVGGKLILTLPSNGTFNFYSSDIDETMKLAGKRGVTIEKSSPFILVQFDETAREQNSDREFFETLEALKRKAEKKFRDAERSDSFDLPALFDDENPSPTINTGVYAKIDEYALYKVIIGGLDPDKRQELIDDLWATAEESERGRDVFENIEFSGDNAIGVAFHNTNDAQEFIKTLEYPEAKERLGEYAASKNTTPSKTDEKDNGSKITARLAGDYVGRNFYEGKIVYLQKEGGYLTKEEATAYAERVNARVAQSGGKAEVTYQGDFKHDDGRYGVHVEFKSAAAAKEFVESLGGKVETRPAAAKPKTAAKKPAPMSDNTTSSVAGVTRNSDGPTVVESVTNDPAPEFEPYDERNTIDIDTGKVGENPKIDPNDSLTSGQRTVGKLLLAGLLFGAAAPVAAAFVSPALVYAAASLISGVAAMDRNSFSGRSASTIGRIATTKIDEMLHSEKVADSKTERTIATSALVGIATTALVAFTPLSVGAGFIAGAIAATATALKGYNLAADKPVLSR